MELGVSQYAKQMNISRGRVLQLIYAGDVQARKIAGRWIINQSELGRHPKISRPLSPRMANAFLEILSKQEISIKLDPSERSRLSKKIKELKEHDDPALLLSSWLKKRGDFVALSANKNDLEKIRKQSEILLSGVSAFGSELSDVDKIEGYISKKDFSKIVRKYLLVKSDNPNVFLRQIEVSVREELVPGLTLSDLSDKYGPRERILVKNLISNL